MVISRFPHVSQSIREDYAGSLHADKIGGDRLFGYDPPSHSTLYPVYRQADATQRLLLCWMALGAILLALVLVIGSFLHR